MYANWRREIWIGAGFLLGSLFFGAVTGHTLGLLLFGLALYLFFQLRHLFRLHRWLLNRQSEEVPDAGGVWGEVFNEIRKLERETARRKERLTGALERFRSASEAVPDGMVVLSQADEIEWANSAAGNLLGLTWPRDHGQRIINLVRNPEFTAYLARREFPEALQIPSPVVPEYRLSVQIIPFGSRQKLVIARDVTRLARLEEMRRNFVANVSHELRTPVTVFKGFVEILEGLESYEPAEVKKTLGSMHEQAGRMQRLVEDLLMLSRLETSAPHVREEWIEVSQMLASLKEQADILSGPQSHRVAVEAEQGVRLYGNREELFSAFSNLVNNAVRYTPREGAIHLRWQAEAGGGALFSVTDTGEGIAPQHIPHLTERFYRVDTGRSRASGGTGLGLSIVKHVLLRHEARLQVKSELGEGSTFTCVFPAARTQKIGTAAPATQASRQA